MHAINKFDDKTLVSLNSFRPAQEKELFLRAICSMVQHFKMLEKSLLA